MSGKSRSSSRTPPVIPPLPSEHYRPSTAPQSISLAKSPRVTFDIEERSPITKHIRHHSVSLGQYNPSFGPRLLSDDAIHSSNGKKRLSMALPPLGVNSISPRGTESTRKQDFYPGPSKVVNNNSFNNNTVGGGRSSRGNIRSINWGKKESADMALLEKFRSKEGGYTRNALYPYPHMPNNTREDSSATMLHKDLNRMDYVLEEDYGDYERWFMVTFLRTFSPSKEKKRQLKSALEKGGSLPQTQS